MPFPKPHEEVSHVGPSEFVERSKWLVEKEYGRLHCKGSNQSDALQHPSTELVGECIGKLTQSNLIEQVVDP